MKTYLLKFDVHNYICFPKGTIIHLLQEEHYNFIVAKGKLKGKKGCVADGLNGWLLDDTATNRKLFLNFMQEHKRLGKAIDALNKKWDELPAAILKNETKS